MPGERPPEAGQREDELNGDEEWPELAGVPDEEGDGAEEQDGDPTQDQIAAGPGGVSQFPSSTLRLQHHVVKSAFQRCRLNESVL